MKKMTSTDKGNFYKFLETQGGRRTHAAVAANYYVRVEDDGKVIVGTGEAPVRNAVYFPSPNARRTAISKWSDANV